MIAAPARKVHWTEEEYLRLESDSPIKHEFLDGEIYAMAGAGARHNVIAANAGAALANIVQGGPCHVFNSDQRIRVADPTKLYTYADAGVACGTWQISTKDGMSLENPVLLVEVLSHSTQEYDRGAKLFLYRQIPSLTDVLLVDPDTRVVEHHHRGARSWRCVVRRKGATPVLGGELPIDALFRLPPGLTADG